MIHFQVKGYIKTVFVAPKQKQSTTLNCMKVLPLPCVMVFLLASNGNSIECKQVQSMTRKVADVDV